MDLINLDVEQRRQTLQELLHKDIYTVTFDKTDGTERVMPCTLREDIIPESARPQGTSRVRKNDVMSVWAVESQSWRSFKLANVKSVVKHEKPKTWIINLEEDPETGDLVMPLPQELLDIQGWTPGDVLEWDIEADSNSFTLKKKAEKKSVI
jgi:hypothetical protein